MNKKEAYTLVLKEFLASIIESEPLEFQELRLAVHLSYRLLTLDFKSAMAFLTLAYAFGALQENTKAYQVLLQHQKFAPKDPDIIQALKEFKGLLLHPTLEVKQEFEAVKVSFKSEIIEPLPTLKETLQALESTSLKTLQNTSQDILPLLRPMLERVSYLEVSNDT